MKLSLCITTYNRYELTLKSFEKVLDDNRISEIVIVDDYSEESVFNNLAAKCFSPKITLYRNEDNLGMSRNKAKVISLAANEWCIIFDSDNVIDSNYLDALELTVLHPDTIYMPEAALPTFNFTKFRGVVFGKMTAKTFMGNPMFRICLNSCNYVVHRDTYLKTYQYDPAIKGADTINHNYNHLKAGGQFYITPGMSYQHLIHNGSGFRADMDYNMKMAADIENKIRQL